MTEALALAPDQALQGWRDQIENNGRLLQTIEDQRRQIEELARLNHEVLFEAGRYKTLAEIAEADAAYQKHVADHRGAALEALAGVAHDMARQLTSFAGRCIDAARIDPRPTTALPTTPSPAQPAAPSAPPRPPVEKPRPAAMTSHEDETTDLPMFLTGGADRHVTPLPEVRP